MIANYLEPLILKFQFFCGTGESVHHSLTATSVLIGSKFLHIFKTYIILLKLAVTSLNSFTIAY